MATVTFILEDESIIKKSPLFIINKTAAQILENIYQINHDQYLLAIKTPTSIEILPPNSIPSKKYPSLIMKPTNDSISKFSFYIFNNLHSDKFFLIFNTINQNNPKINFPFYIFGFNPSQYTNKSISDFKKDLVKHFDIPISDAEIFLNERKISDSLNFTDFLIQAKQIYQFQPLVKKPPLSKKKFTKLDFKFNIEAPGLNKIISRENILKEIYKTEIEYCSHLILLNSHFSKNFAEKKILTEKEHHDIFRPIQKMIDTSTYLTNSLTNLQSYSSCVGSLFSSFIFQLEKTSQEYFINYNKMTKKVTQKLDENSFVKEICRQSPGKNDATFQSIVIQPILRFPKYVLLFNELAKYTPKSHPDYLAIQKAKTELSQMVHSLEEAHLVRSVRDIQERLVTLKEYENHSIVTKDRILVEAFNVSQKEKKKSRATLYLFNDMILLTSGTEREIEQMRSSYTEFFFIPNYMDNLTIAYFFRDEYRTIEFNTQEQLKKFITILNEKRNKMFENNPSTIKATEYLSPTNQIIPPMTDTSCCRLSNTISIISHKLYLLFDTSHQTLTISNETKNIHKHSKGVIVNNIPYTFGGKKKSGPFELINNKFEEIKSKNIKAKMTTPEVIINTRSSLTESPKEGRIYHTACSYDNFIVIYGGFNPKSRHKLFSDIHFYSVENGEWYISDPTIISPIPRYKHSAVVYKNMMIIHGGISAVNHTILNDTWCYNFLNGKWNLIKMKNHQVVVPRFGHSAVMVNRFMFIIGGSTDQSNDINCSCPFISNSKSFQMDDWVAAPDHFCLNIENGQMTPIEIEGNFLKGLSMFSAIYDETKNTILIFGGKDPKNKASKGLPIITVLDIPRHFKSKNSKTVDYSTDIEKVFTFTPPINRQSTLESLSSLNPLLTQIEDEIICNKDEKTKSTVNAACEIDDEHKSLTPLRVHHPVQSKNNKINAPRFYRHLRIKNTANSTLIGQIPDNKKNENNFHDENMNDNCYILNTPIYNNVRNQKIVIDVESEEEEEYDDVDVTPQIILN